MNEMERKVTTFEEMVKMNQESIKRMDATVCSSFQNITQLKEGNNRLYFQLQQTVGRCQEE